MGEVIQLWGRTESFDPLFQKLVNALGMPALKAKDGTSEEKADVMVAGCMAVARALVIICDGDPASLAMMKGITH